jgi:hypothetical protein
VPRITAARAIPAFGVFAIAPFLPDAEGFAPDAVEVPPVLALAEALADVPLICLARAWNESKVAFGRAFMANTMPVPQWFDPVRLCQDKKKELTCDLYVPKVCWQKPQIGAVSLTVMVNVFGSAPWAIGLKPESNGWPAGVPGASGTHGLEKEDLVRKRR